MSEKYKFIGDAAYDNLISGVYPATQLKEVAMSTASGADVELKRGTVLNKGADGTYTVAGSAKVDATDLEGDGSTKVFSVVSSAPLAHLSSVKIAGVETDAYTFYAETQKIAFDNAPADDAAIKISGYTGKCDCILCEDVVLPADGTAVSFGAYTAGCFDPNFCIVASGYALTDKDFDDLRDLGIFFEEALK